MKWHQPEERVSHRLRQGPASSSCPDGWGRNFLGILSESSSAASLRLWRREAHQLVANSIPVKGTPWSVETARGYTGTGWQVAKAEVKWPASTRTHRDHNGHALVWTDCTGDKDEIWQLSPVLPRDGESNSVLLHDFLNSTDLGWNYSSLLLLHLLRWPCLCSNLAARF
jgi:hypothetical protein